MQSLQVEEALQDGQGDAESEDANENDQISNELFSDDESDKDDDHNSKIPKDIIKQLSKSHKDVENVEEEKLDNDELIMNQQSATSDSP